MKNLFKIETFAVIIFIIFSIYGYAHIYTNHFFSDYSFNELFINYQAGFVRRGLLGEIFGRYIHTIILIQDYFLLSVFVLYFIKIILLYLI